MFDCNMTVTTNVRGIPYIESKGITVTAESVDISLGFRRIPKIGEIAILIANAIPEGTTGTLPVRITLNGNTRALTFFGGTAVTAAELTGTGVVKVWYDMFNGILELTSPVAPTAAAAADDTNP